MIQNGFHLRCVNHSCLCFTRFNLMKHKNHTNRKNTKTKTKTQKQERRHNEV